MAHDERPDGRRRSLLQLGCVVCRLDGCRGTQGAEVERNASCPEGDGGTQLAGPSPVAQPRSEGKILQEHATWCHRPSLRQNSRRPPSRLL